MKHKAAGTIALLACYLLWAIGENTATDTKSRLKELDGHHYVPPQPFLLRPEFRTASGLADWQLIEDSPPEIVKVRVVGIVKTKTGESLDWTTDDPIILKTIEEAFSPTRMRRQARSDFSERRGGLLGGFGVVELELKNGKLIIGVSPVGFFFGVRIGSDLQLFESWLLCKQLDDICRKQTGSGFEPGVFARLSGLEVLDEQRAVYGDIRDASPVKKP